MEPSSSSSEAHRLNINVGCLGHVDSGKTSLGALILPSFIPKRNFMDLYTQCSCCIVDSIVDCCSGQAPTEQGQGYNVGPWVFFFYGTFGEW